MTNLKFNDVTDDGNKFIVSIRDTKTYLDRQFIIGPLFYNKVKQYTDLRPSDSPDRFFVNYAKGKCTRQVIGKNKIGETPQAIALFLGLPDPKTYTGHCFRRTSATLLCDSGASVQNLKQLGGWRSETVALGYVENSMHGKQKLFNGIIHASTSKQLSPPPSIECNSTATHSNVIQENSMVLDWDDFSDDFTFVRAETEPPSAGFVTAAGEQIEIPEVNMQIALSPPKNQEPQDTKTTITTPLVQSELSKTGTSSTAGILKANQQVQHSRTTTTTGFDSSDTPEIALAPIKRPFFERKPVKLNFQKSDSSAEPPSKKKTLVHTSAHLTLNEDSINNNSPAKYENCTFHNCTFNFN